MWAKKAVEYFEAAIKADPSYAPAYAGMALNYTWFGGAGVLGLHPLEAYTKAREAVTRALELDDTLAEGHVARAYLTHFFEWNWERAENEYKRALELNPNLAMGYEMYAEFLMAMGRFDQAVAELKRARALDPLSLAINIKLGWPYLWTRQYEQAINVWQKALELDPNFPLAHYNLGVAYTRLGRYDEGIREYRKALGSDPENPVLLALLGEAYGRAGRRSEAVKLLNLLQKRAEKDYVPHFLMAAVYTGLGQKAQALTSLETAYQQREPWLVVMNIEPGLDPLRADPRFQSILRKMNFPSAGAASSGK